MSDFVLEIGAENLPASYIPPAVAQLAEDARAMLARCRLEYDEISTTGTPRRLALVVRGLAARQAAAEEVVTGPPVSKAFDENGRPTKAAEGFARSQGAAVDALHRVETPRGEYLAVRKRLARRATKVVLREEIPALIGGLKFPKTMKWEASGARFARPVRWIVALYGRDVVPVRFGDVASGRVTCGRPWMRDERRSVPDAGAYEAAIRALGVVLDPEERRRRIRRHANTAAAARKASVVEDKGLVTELSFMTEDPRGLVGGFDREFLELPPEVIVTAMRAHQRYIALVDRKGRLLPVFVTFTDGPVRGPKEVVHGNERVLHARLADARFYWRDDLKHGVDGLADQLDRIVFIEGLGSLGAKWRRILEIARDVNARIDPAQRVPDDVLARAARLAKADLASTMIRDGKEFTALQGVIGAHYAAAGGEDDAVVRAIREHYQPRAAGDPLPDSVPGRILAFADRVDTLVGAFLAGLKPTGSQDPYALRRGGNGAVRLACELRGVRLDEVATRAAGSYGSVLSEAEIETRWNDGGIGAEMLDFLRARVDAFLKENGVPYDIADAVAPVSWAEPGRALARAREIAGLRGEARFERLITGVKRVGNILARDRRRIGAAWSDVTGLLSGDGAGGFSAGRFQDPAESTLLDAVMASLEPIETRDSRDDFGGVLTVLSGLADPIDAYFDRVLVNVDDEAVRENRHAFLAAVYSLFGRFADFQAIVEQSTAD